jgi:hypothetical protein
MSMTITTHPLLVLFFCLSTTTAVAMQQKDFIKILNKTAPAEKKSVTFAPENRQNPDVINKKKRTLSREKARYAKTVKHAH